VKDNNMFALMDSTWLSIVYAVIAALPPTIASLAVLRQGKRAAITNLAQALKLEDKVDDNTAKTETVNKKADVIHDLTNSNLTAIKTELSEAKTRIEKLENLVLTLTGKIPTT